MKDDNHFVINQRDNRQVAKRDGSNCNGRVRTGVSSIHGGFYKMASRNVSNTFTVGGRSV
jgi:hypothetical protein